MKSPYSPNAEDGPIASPWGCFRRLLPFLVHDAYLYGIFVLAFIQGLLDGLVPMIIVLPISECIQNMYDKDHNVIPQERSAPDRNLFMKLMVLQGVYNLTKMSVKVSANYCVMRTLASMRAKLRTPVNNFE